MADNQTNYEKETQAIQRWLKTTAGLNSFPVAQTPPKLVRPVVMLLAPYRGRDRNVDRYRYVNKVIQYGILYAATLPQGMALQDGLSSTLEEAVGKIPIFGMVDDGTGGQIESKIAEMFDADIEYQNTNALDVPFQLTYYIQYTRVRPYTPPPTFVGTRITGTTGSGTYDFNNYPNKPIE
jgi:hypothetical protein